jgi:hypothetical protein
MDGKALDSRGTAEAFAPALSSGAPVTMEGACQGFIPEWDAKHLRLAIEEDEGD